MSNVLGLWHLVLKGGQEELFQTPAIVQISNASYGEEIVDENSRSVVKLTFAGLAPDEDDEDVEELKVEDVTTVLCALTPGKIEHATLSVTLCSDESFKLQNTGKNTVYLTGNYLDAGALDSDSEADTDGEDAYLLGDVSSDVEMHPDDLDSDGDRFEEVDADKTIAKPMKRPRESDSAVDSKAGNTERKKKLKADDGKAVSVEVPSAGEKSQEKEKKKKKKEKKAEDSPKKDQKVDIATKTTTGGVIIEDHKIGTGAMAKKGDTVRMRYIGKLTTGKEFDKNVSGKPFTFRLGKGEVIKGWDEGIVGMQVDGERKLTIPAAMAYGKEEKPGIPRNSDLLFEVKLLGIKSKS